MTEHALDTFQLETVSRSSGSTLRQTESKSWPTDSIDEIIWNILASV